MLSPESITGGERKLIGSMIVMPAEKLEDVRAIIESDVYYTSGVVSPSTSPCKSEVNYSSPCLLSGIPRSSSLLRSSPQLVLPSSQRLQ